MYKFNGEVIEKKNYTIRQNSEFDCRLCQLDPLDQFSKDMIHI